MKPRRVIVEIELETVLTIKELKFAYGMSTYIQNEYVTPIQVQVNVIRQPEPKPKRR